MTPRCVCVHMRVFGALARAVFPRPRGHFLDRAPRGRWEAPPGLCGAPAALAPASLRRRSALTAAMAPE